MTRPITEKATDLQLFTLQNSKETRVTILNIGATVFDFFIKDKNGNFVNVLVKPNSPETYLSPEYMRKTCVLEHL